MVPACLPIPPSLHVATLLLDGEGLTLLASFAATAVPCPLCGQLADRVHSRYTRSLADLPWATLVVRLRVVVRKFFCANAACPRQVFAERLVGIAHAHARRTDRQREALTAIAFANGGEARLARKLGLRSAPIRSAAHPARPRRRAAGADCPRRMTGPSPKG